MLLLGHPQLGAGLVCVFSLKFDIYRKTHAPARRLRGRRPAPPGGLENRYPALQSLLERPGAVQDNVLSAPEASNSVPSGIQDAFSRY